MWLLARILPLLVGDYVDEEEDQHWQLYLQMMNIVDLIFCPKTSHDHAAYISTLISDHHSTFSQLYDGRSIIPKMHFMVHMPKLMIRYSFKNHEFIICLKSYFRYGPLVRHWTMRFEAKHSYFKQLAHSLGNFINLPYSLASRHQQYQCYLNTVTCDRPSSVESLEVGPGYIIFLLIDTFCIKDMGTLGSVVSAEKLEEKTGSRISTAFRYTYLGTY